jgi:DNA-binding PadR family transcriptional regulator
MFGARHCDPDPARWAARRGWRGPFDLGFGWGGRHRLGGGDILRAGRMLATGDLRLIALALIAERPRHGYEIIKLLEEKTAGWYSPSPGIVYPTLTYLEEAGYVTGEARGARKLYTITEEGRAYLAENRDFVDAVLERLEAWGEKITRMRRRFSGEREERQAAVPPLVKAALDNLREAAAARLEEDAEAEPRIVDILARAAQEVRRG